MTNNEINDTKTASQIDSDTKKKLVNDASTQTENVAVDVEVLEEPKDAKNTVDTKTSEWNVNKDVEDKSIEEQVKEVAQSALQESGMVYVESAGMYYDYKTGYYYNSELGLYYHTDTGCYYYYSEEKQNFVFHSYPDRSILAANAPLIMHAMKKAKKHKKAIQLDVENLTKNFSQEKEEDANEESSKPKRKKVNKEEMKSCKKKECNKVKKIHKETKSEEKTATEAENIESEPKDCKVLYENEEPTEIENPKEGSKKEDFKTEEDNGLEDGECSETESEEETQEDDVEDIISINSMSTVTDDDDDSVAKQHPPCMRLIVRETNVTKLKVGSLFLITKDGGTIGREGEQHAIIITDSNVSRNHLDIKYNLERNMYYATDLGSKNGTILNGIRMSDSQDTSFPMEVVHGSVIELGETKLLCHIHPGNDTCGHCEPGLIMESEDKERKVAYTRTCSVQKQHRLELARLKNLYATRPPAIEAEAYNDRAHARRQTVGSSHHAEKTQSSDIDTFIASENKGFKLLEKMGWSKGEGLGKDSQGDKEPIPLVSNEGKSGLGTSSSTEARPAYNPPKSTLGPATLRLAARTKMLQPPAKAFQDPVNSYDSE
ncbi:unnamed protein product, partial [Iphiclides podalirius]